MDKNHNYKIGKKVRHIGTGLDYFIVGIKTSSYVSFGKNETMLVIHKNNGEPTRNGYAVHISHVELIDGH